MSTPKSDGGFAFPFHRIYANGEESSSGMTLRDYFAAKTINAIVSNAEITKGLALAKSKMTLDEMVAFDTKQCPEAFAKVAYAYADALLVERQRP